MSLTPEFIQHMDVLYQQLHAHDANKTDRLERYRNIEPDSALFLAMQVRIKNAQRILEIGTSTGFSTLWLAQAVTGTTGAIDSIEIDPDRIAQAKSYAKHFQLDGKINFHQADALTYLKHASAYYDLILLDAERDAYCDYWYDLIRLMQSKTGVLFVDNVISHAHELTDFLALLKQDQRFISTTLPIGAGILMLTWA